MGPQPSLYVDDASGVSLNGNVLGTRLLDRRTRF